MVERVEVARSNAELDLGRRFAHRRLDAQDFALDLGVRERDAEILRDPDHPVARIQQHPVRRDRRRGSTIGEAAFPEPSRPDPAMPHDGRRDAQGVPDRDRLVDRELDGAHHPAEAPSQVPAAIEAHVLGVAPRDVLRVTEQRRRPQPALRPRLVEPNAVAGEEAVVDARDGSRRLAGEAWIEELRGGLGVHRRSLARARSQSVVRSAFTRRPTASRMDSRRPGPRVATIRAARARRMRSRRAAA